MKLGDLSPSAIRRRLRGDGLCLRTGPFNYRIRTPIDSVASGLGLLYEQVPLVDDSEYIDFTISMARGRGLRRWFRPQVRFEVDGETPFEPLPEDHAYPMLEWAMNWCVSTQAHQYLLLHSAVIERDGRAVIMPAPPGSGKSTLCAALIHRGWRLMSDELALINPFDGRLVALARPVSLKNESLDVIQRFEPSAVLNTPVGETFKGKVSHMKVPEWHLSRIHETASARWVVFPQYQAGAEARLEPRPKADSLLELAQNAFNYSLLGPSGFRTLGDLVDRSDCYRFTYSKLEQAMAVFERLCLDAQTSGGDTGHGHAGSDKVPPPGRADDGNSP